MIIQVGELIGIWPTLALLLLDAIGGSLLLKHQGRGAWRRFNEALAERRFPGKEVVDGVLIVIGGALLIAPGFITDIFGLFFLIPPTRALARGAAALHGRPGRRGRLPRRGRRWAASAAGRRPGPGPEPRLRLRRDAEEVPTNGTASPSCRAARARDGGPGRLVIYPSQGVDN